MISKQQQKSDSRKIIEANKFKAYLNNNDKFVNYKFGKDEMLNESMDFLSGLLRDYYGTKVFLLVDEFDKPVNSFLSSDDKGDILNKIKWAKIISKMISNIISPCSKGINQSTERIILTGILNSQVLGVSSSMNNFKEEGVLSGSLGGCLGFSNDEIDWVLDQVFRFKNTKYKKLIFDKLKEWYSGQIINNTEVFTPFSIMRYLSDIITYLTAYHF